MLLSPCFVAGAGAYMASPFEPGRWPTLAAFFALSTATALLWRVGRARLPALWALAAGLGFVWAMAHADLVSAPRIDREGAGELRGEAVWIEAGEGRPRLELADAVFSRFGRETRLAKARVRLTGGAGIRVGDVVRVRAIMRPPPPPVAPGAFDFRRNAYFKQIGAVGFAIGQVEIVRRGGGVGTWFGRARAGFRDAIYRALPERPDLAGVIAALTVGDRSGVSATDNDALRASGLAHLLAISGLHLGMAAGGVYLALRVLLAAPHGLALRLPAHKLAAVGAILAAAVYLGLSGAAPPAQRAFVMVLAAMLAILTDRLRSGLWFVAWAAVVVTAAAPDVVVGPSFQLSFAAATGIVAAYEVLSARRRDREEPAFVGFGPLRPVAAYVAGVAGASLIATAATAPLALAHFQQAPVLGVLANLAAMPAMAFVVMPSAVLAGCLAPFGLADAPLAAMALGVDAILGVAHTVAGWPGGVVRAAATGGWVVFAFLAGGALFIVLRGWPRHLALLGPAVAVAGLVTASSPDVLVSEDGRLAAVARDGRLYVTSTARGRFQREVWRRHVGVADEAPLDDPALDWARCDDRGCVLETRAGRVAISTAASGFRDDCARSDLVVALHRHTGPCAAGRLIDGWDVAREGAHAIELSPDGAKVTTVRQIHGGRLWSEAGPSTAGSDRRDVPER